MRTNIGKYERIVRILLGIFLAFLAFSQYLTGYLAWTAAFIGIILFITGVVRWCGIYSLFGISTKGSGINKISIKDIERAVKSRPIDKKVDKIEVIKPQNKPASKKSTTNKKTPTKPISSQKSKTSTTTKKATPKKSTKTTAAKTSKISTTKKSTTAKKKSTTTKKAQPKKSLAKK